MKDGDCRTDVVPHFIDGALGIGKTTSRSFEPVDQLKALISGIVPFSCRTNECLGPIQCFDRLATDNMHSARGALELPLRSQHALFGFTLAFLDTPDLISCPMLVPDRSLQTHNFLLFHRFDIVRPFHYGTGGSKRRPPAATRTVRPMFRLLRASVCHGCNRPVRHRSFHTTPAENLRLQSRQEAASCLPSKT